jgi:cell division protein FtsL
VAQGTLVVILALYILDMCLWIIDVRNVVTELDFTLISNSTDSLDTKHSRSGKSQLRLALVEDVLYAYMVCNIFSLSCVRFIYSSAYVGLTGGCDHVLACLCILACR